MKNAGVVTRGYVLGFISQYIDEHGYAPSVREIAAALGKSQTGVQYAIEQLERAGEIKRGPRGTSRTITVIR